MMRRRCYCRDGGGSAAGAAGGGGGSNKFFKLLLMGLLVVGSHVMSTSSSSLGVVAAAASSSTPVIGIMTQPLPTNYNDGDKNIISNSTYYYIAASYVKWLELGGARSIAIPYDATPEILEDIFYQINGILFTGGALDDIVPNSAKYLWKLIVQANNNNNENNDDENNENDFFPVWGTCLGFEWLIELACGSDTSDNDLNEVNDTSCSLSSNYRTENVSLPLYNIPTTSLLYPPNTQMLDIVQHYNVTMNNHHRGITPQNFHNSSKLTNYWNITSTNYDILLNSKDDTTTLEFVSTIEPKYPDKFPVYGVQYHPEKNIFEYGTYPQGSSNIPYESIDHTIQGITMSFELSKFFVNLTRTNMYLQQQQRQKNGHVGRHRIHEYTKFDTYPYVYTYPIQLGVYHFEQIYIIPPSSSVASSSSLSLSSSETATSS